MYLKSLTLKGFKSFADRSHMVFEPGLTVIVGPNGSGKSNVSDAIRWVLGEQSAKQLRGQAMEDVVFAGSSARKPVGMAEVDLTLDNSDHVLPVDFEEVVITRRMYRSGESEYLINGAPARLLDITDILHDTGLGKETHSIIGQGKLDSILASRPEDRRTLIEEAAGISKHKRRRERSIKKLENMEAHLQRALDVQKEVARQLKPLERQVDRARRAGDLEARARKLRCSLAVDDLRRLQVRWDDILRRESQTQAELDMAQVRVDERTRELDKLRMLLEEKGMFAGDLSEQRRRCQSVVERVESSSRLLDEKDRHMASRITELTALVAGDETRSRQILEETERARVEYDEAVAALQTLSARQREARESVDAAKKARRKAEDEMEKARGKCRSIQKDRDQCAISLAKAQDGVKNAQIQDEMFARRADQLAESIAQGQAELDASRARLAQAEEDLAKAKADEVQAAQAVAQARRAVDEAQRGFAAAQRDLSSAEARAHAMRAAVEQEENAAPLAARLAQDPASAGALARVNEILNVPGELEGLVEHLLRDSLSGFVVADSDSLVNLGRAAQRVSAGSGGTVQIVGASVRRSRDAVDAPGNRLLDRISCLPGYEAVMEALLGDVWVLPDVEQACNASLDNPDLRFVTPDGAMASRGSVLAVGRVGDAGQGILERRRSLRELEEGLPRRREDLETERRSLEAAESALSEARGRQGEVSSVSARLMGETKSLSSDVSRLEGLVRRNEAELASVKAQQDQAKAKSAKAFEDLELQQGRLELLNVMYEEATSLRVETEEAFEKARRKASIAHEEANDAQLELTRVQERSRSLERGNSRLEEEQRQLATRIADSREELLSLGMKTRRVGPLKSRLAELAKSARELSLALNDRAALAEADSASIKETIESARDAVTAAEQARSRAVSALGEIRVQKGRLEVQVDQAVKSISSQPGVILEEALELPEPQDRAADERELQSLDRQLAEIGPVNQVAFEEYRALKERADYLDGQIGDLQHARADLRKILAAIDRKMRDGFVEAFEAVNANFTDIFGMLFPGGHGHLEMTDPEDVSATGIEVVAQPKGKRVAKMSLLSGGERSLTALGLLFAVYRTRSVPFYVLDEVEAALDDSNLDRLLGAIDQLRDDTQLIVISHQRRTMESADVLYGVSMKADGVSTVVSQKLERH